MRTLAWLPALVTVVAILGCAAPFPALAGGAGGACGADEDPTCKKQLATPITPRLSKVTFGQALDWTLPLRA